MYLFKKRIVSPSWAILAFSPFEKQKQCKLGDEPLAIEFLTNTDTEVYRRYIIIAATERVSIVFSIIIIIIYHNNVF